MKKMVLLFMTLFCSFLFSCNNKQYYMALGSFSKDLITNIDEKLNIQGNDYFVNENMQSGELFKIADSNASYFANGKQYPFFSIAEKAKLFIINIGLDDFLPSMEIDPSNNILNYDMNLVKKQLEVYDYHLVHILDEIREINNKAPIYVLSTYNNYLFEKPEQMLFNSLVNMINTAIKDSLNSYKDTHFISLQIIEEKVYDNPQINQNALIAEIVGSYYDERS